MSDRGDTADAEEERQRERGVEDEVETETGAADDEVVLDVAAAEEREREFERLVETVEEQAERIEELEDMVLDLSVRAADDRSMGVCPDCHGPVVKNDRWLRSSTIDCQRCGRRFHTY
ncbi:MAG: hypothetical protein ABEH40_04895 [Haloferacaceae archaeon]